MCVDIRHTRLFSLGDVRSLDTLSPGFMLLRVLGITGLERISGGRVYLVGEAKWDDVTSFTDTGCDMGCDMGCVV